MPVSEKSNPAMGSSREQSLEMDEGSEVNVAVAVEVGAPTRRIGLAGGDATAPAGGGSGGGGRAAGAVAQVLGEPEREAAGSAGGAP